MRDGVAKPSTKASGAASILGSNHGPKPGGRRCSASGSTITPRTGDENTPPGATEASDTAPSAPRPPSSSISTGIEASVPGAIPRDTTGVLGREAVDAVDDAGDASVRGIGENGGSDPLGMDANDNTSLSAETAIPEIGADEVGSVAAESEEGAL
ncbi:unnamed protein product [Phytophthora fragariaefolia]|uniref:Unnamed protein product n=1 Tax=Phytophthora fragariaefolia TaxID=1490495 RepID=A0A9W6X8M7_9STRA|nr:unnamed protein product [Phytophthora fragariaefolia]